MGVFLPATKQNTNSMTKILEIICVRMCACMYVCGCVHVRQMTNAAFTPSHTCNEIIRKTESN